MIKNAVFISTSKACTLELGVLGTKITHLVDLNYLMMYIQVLCLEQICVQMKTRNSETGTLANSGDPDDIPHNGVFNQFKTNLQRKK